VNHRVSARGIQTELPVARLKPAVGEISRQAPPKLRGLDECPSCPEYQTNNPGRVRNRQQVNLRPGANGVSWLSPSVYFVCAKGQRDRGIECRR
jgi:hypothetical protein